MSIACKTKNDEISDISCRVCLKTFASNYYELGSPMDSSIDDGPTFAEAIQVVTDFFEITSAIQWICSLCAEELKIAFNFLQKIRNTEKLLRSQRVDLKSLFLGDDNLEILSTNEEIEHSLLEPLNLEHDLKDTLKIETDNSFKLFIEEESSFSFGEEEEIEESPLFEALGLQLHCSPCNKTFESQESMNNHKTWHLTNDLSSSGGVVNEVIINPPSDCEDESKEEGKIEELTCKRSYFCAEVVPTLIPFFVFVLICTLRCPVLSTALIIYETPAITMFGTEE